MANGMARLSSVVSLGRLISSIGVVRGLLILLLVAGVASTAE